MSKKEKFLMFVYLAGMSRDAVNRTSDAARIALHASRIKEEVIPCNVHNAAVVLVQCLHGNSRPFKWMTRLG